ncbi:hypothetical protein [Pseudonocardia acaciae]|uniref:hypothetical protein n=1 Tax=Pseudonocardia acaciae TaxID=551276 RepID=UPI00048D4C09|nr:hypothetical protein [Pseudonocardia acaciae]
MNSTILPRAALSVILLGLTGCAAYQNATPEETTFPLTGTTLNVKAHDVPTDLIPVDRKDVKVIRRFDVKSGNREASWELKDGVLDLVAQCTGFGNCDARYEVQVPRGVKVLRDGKPTDLK